MNFVVLKNNSTIFVKNSDGFLVFKIVGGLKEYNIKLDNFILFKKRQINVIENKNFHFLLQHLNGLETGFKTFLEIKGLGYKVFLEKNSLLFKIGYSHTVSINIPRDVSFFLKKKRLIKITALSLHAVKSITKKIQKLKKPDLYKNKGISVFNEKIILKEGKKRKR